MLWWLEDSPALGQAARAAIGKGTNQVFVSAASAWEIEIKVALGKLKAPRDLEKALALNRFEPLSMTVGHAIAAGRLPRHHEDPFDRMLIAQSKIERLTVVTSDRYFALYGVNIVAA